MSYFGYLDIVFIGRDSGIFCSTTYDENTDGEVTYILYLRS